MIFDKILSALDYNLKKAMEHGGTAESERYLTYAKRFFEMAVKDIEKNSEGYINQQIQKYDDEQSGMHTKFHDTETHISETLNESKPTKSQINESKLDKALKNYKRLF